MRILSHVHQNQQSRCHKFILQQLKCNSGGNKNKHAKTQQYSRTFSSTTTTLKNKTLEDHHFCVDLVRTRDKEGYLCGLLQPSGSSRDAYFATRAFNVEIASIKDGQKSRSAGSIQASQMRMQWWREAVGDMYNKNIEIDDFDHGQQMVQNPAALHQPVVRSLRRAVEDWGLTKRFLEKMVDAREMDLEVEQMDTIDDLIRYGANTNASLMYLSLESVGVRDSVADEAAYHIAIAQTITTALRSLPYQAARGELAIPSDLMVKYSIPSTYLFRPDNDSHKPALREAVIEMASVARTHMNIARDLQSKVPKEGRISLLPAVGVALYLEKLETIADFDILHQDLYTEKGGLGKQSVIWHPLLLGRAWLTGIF